METFWNFPFFFRLSRRKDHCHWESVEACCRERLKSRVRECVCVVEKPNTEERCVLQQEQHVSQPSRPPEEPAQKKKLVFKQRKKKRNRVHMFLILRAQQCHFVFFSLLSSDVQKMVVFYCLLFFSFILFLSFPPEEYSVQWRCHYNKDVDQSLLV